MLKIKLSPRGKKHQRTFRIVVAEERSKINGPPVADLGFFTPQTKTLQIDKEKLAQWQKNGAKLTQGVAKLLNPAKLPPKPKKQKKVTAQAKPEPSQEKSPEISN